MTPLERFNDLPSKHINEILAKYRGWNVEHTGWWDCVYDDFKASMATIGIEVDQMYFSVSCSQGDGACFEGRVEDWELFLKSVGHPCPALITLAQNTWSFSVEHMGHYYHENCTRFDARLITPDSNGEEAFAHIFSPYKSEIQTAAWMALIAGYTPLDLEEAFEEAFKDHMRSLCKQLEAEYDDLTSNEAVLESLDANDMLTEIIDQLEEVNA